MAALPQAIITEAIKEGVDFCNQVKWAKLFTECSNENRMNIEGISDVDKGWVMMLGVCYDGFIERYDVSMLSKPQIVYIIAKTLMNNRKQFDIALNATVNLMENVKHHSSN